MYILKIVKLNVFEQPGKPLIWSKNSKPGEHRSLMSVSASVSTKGSSRTCLWSGWLTIQF